MLMCAGCRNYVHVWHIPCSNGYGRDTVRRGCRVNGMEYRRECCVMATKRTAWDKVLAVFIVSAFASVAYYSLMVQRVEAGVGMVIGMGIAISLIIRGRYSPKE